jgi:hypothetical protein
LLLHPCAIGFGLEDQQIGDVGGGDGVGHIVALRSGKWPALAGYRSPSVFYERGLAGFSYLNWLCEAIFGMAAGRNLTFNANLKQLRILGLTALSKTDESDTHRN